MREARSAEYRVVRRVVFGLLGLISLASLVLVGAYLTSRVPTRLAVGQAWPLYTVLAAQVGPGETLYLVKWRLTPGCAYLTSQVVTLTACPEEQK